MQIRILVADDHSLIRQGIRRLFGGNPSLSIVAEASNGIDAVSLAKKHRPDIAIIDLSMKDLNGIDAIKQIARRCPMTSIIVLTMFSDERYVNRAVRAGAKAYVLKDSADDDLLRAVYAIHEGNTFFSPAIAKVLLDAHARSLDGTVADDRYELLTEREREVYQMLAQGKTNKAIAAALGLSVHTVETHRVRVMAKLDLHNTAELALSAVRRGIIA